MIAIVLHTMGGSLAGTDSWFRNPSSEVSAHFGIGLDGAVHQYVDLKDGAWGNGILEPGNRWPGATNPNYSTVSIETEDRGDPHQVVTPEQYQSVLWVCRMVTERFTSIATLATHAAISPHSRAHCPGERWVSSGLFHALADTLVLAPLT